MESNLPGNAPLGGHHIRMKASVPVARERDLLAVRGELGLVVNRRVSREWSGPPAGGRDRPEIASPGECER